MSKYITQVKSENKILHLHVIYEPEFQHVSLGSVFPFRMCNNVSADISNTVPLLLTYVTNWEGEGGWFVATNFSAKKSASKLDDDKIFWPVF